MKKINKGTDTGIVIGLTTSNLSHVRIRFLVCLKKFVLIFFLIQV